MIPGRLSRFREPALRSIAEITALLANELEPIFSKPQMPFIFLGHSMGTVVAFEFIQEMKRRGWTLPLHLIVSGRMAPHEISRDTPIAHLPDQQFLDIMERRYNYTRIDPELEQLILPSMKADIFTVENYRCPHPADVPDRKLSMPITAFTGTRDRHVFLDQVQTWASWTTGPFTIHQVNAGHFYYELPEYTQVVRQIVTATASRAQ
eukprot:GAFH01004665.1.p2 GENE.GAFH01004665.1~~GAFH01004665.1.p2  ORF type:complete len:225 (+),score=39.25 GAFH01004665.1:57-677(+)